MNFSEKLQLLRKNKGLTQEELAEKTGVSRQAVAKWEAGQVYPDIFNLIQISNLMNVSVDYLVKDQDCAVRPAAKQDSDLEELIAFRLEANVHTYAAFQNEVDSTRPQSHDFRYGNGRYLYHDTYVGGEQFAGEEAVLENTDYGGIYNCCLTRLSDGAVLVDLERKTYTKTAAAPDGSSICIYGYYWTPTVMLASDPDTLVAKARLRLKEAGDA